VDAPVGEVVVRIVAHLRDLRPDVVVTHDQHGGATGHLDHVRTHEVTVAAVRAAGDAGFRPDLGEAWTPRSLHLATHPHSARRMLTDVIGARRTVHTVPDEQATALDVSAWLDQKVAAIVAHRSEVERGALPGLVAGMAAAERRRLLGTEWYVRTPVARAGHTG
jgi:N-acetyl-1-D-myo-inositol-2-amino-2-deoxy-alpha-D-glucopyranoside deacetylase